MASAIVAGFLVCRWDRAQGGAVSLRCQNSWESNYLCEQGWAWGAGTQDLIPGADMNWKERVQACLACGELYCMEDLHLKSLSSALLPRLFQKTQCLSKKRELNLPPALKCLGKDKCVTQRREAKPQAQGWCQLPDCGKFLDPSSEK